MIPKFRAWDKKRKTMYEVCNLILNQYPKQKVPQVWANLWAFDVIKQKAFLLHAEDIELMQFTGLYDSHDKPIFEGDVVKSEWQHDGVDCHDWDAVAPVAYDEGMACFIMKKIGEDEIFLPFHDFDRNELYSLEVIGNIYEAIPAISR